MFLFNDGLFLMISRLSLISNKYFLFSWAKTLKLSKEVEKLQWSKWSQIALLFDGLTFFPARGDIATGVSPLTAKKLKLSNNSAICDHLLHYKICGSPYNVNMRMGEQ